ncbi:unnamed protein product [Arabis nemorensis]|uniref:BZIP domain-containing protein n=1 Tax=Arabis nemorensis TaxID=586526 RepID=A0A565C4G2_9BRAS|nr:unnamed protein product [Arabis nemorensis]
MNRNVDNPQLSIDGSSGSQSPNPVGNEDGGDNGRRTVVTPPCRSLRPPISPYSKISTIQQQLASQNFSLGPCVPMRPVSQLSSLFSSMPPLRPLSPSTQLLRDSTLSSRSLLPIRRSSLNSVRVSDKSTTPLPPPRTARKQCTTNDDVPFRSGAFFAPSPTGWSYPKPTESPVVGEKIQEEKMNLFLSAACDMNMDMGKSEALKGNENVGYEMEKTSSEGRSVNEIGSGAKRRAGKDIATSKSHYKSLSLDTFSIGKFGTRVESSNPPLSPGLFSPTDSGTGVESSTPPLSPGLFSPTNSGTRVESSKPPLSAGLFSPTNSGTGAESSKQPLSPGLFSPTHSGMVTPSEMEQIEGNEKPAGLAKSSLKTSNKRKQANRESAARSKERKAQYVADLEDKLRTVEFENGRIRNKYNQSQRNQMVTDNQLREMTIRYEAMEEKARILAALTDQLTARVNELTNELNLYRREAQRSNMQQSLSTNMFQQLNINQMHQPERNPDFDGKI